MAIGGLGVCLFASSGLFGCSSKEPTSPRGVGGERCSEERLLNLCSLLPEERLENDSNKRANDDITMVQESKRKKGKRKGTLEG